MSQKHKKKRTRNKTSGNYSYANRFGAHDNLFLFSVKLWKFFSLIPVVSPISFSPSTGSISPYDTYFYFENPTKCNSYREKEFHRQLVSTDRDGITRFLEKSEYRVENECGRICAFFLRLFSMAFFLRCVWLWPAFNVSIGWIIFLASNQQPIYE